MLATLTETPYSLTLGDSTFSVDVSNRYHEDEADTSDVAQEALLEALNARVPGMKKGKLLTTVDTGYSAITGDLRPSRKDGKKNLSSFEEAFVETARRLAVPIPDPQTGYRILSSAPKAITGLKLTDTQPTFQGDTTTNDMVTESGIIVRTVIRKGELFSKEGMPKKVQFRGGRAPQPGIARLIQNRVVSLRTKHAKR